MPTRRLKRIPGQFDYVLAEAILTMQSETGKAKILQGIRDRLKPNGLFLSHELRAEAAQAEAIQQDLSATIRINAAPLSAEGWIAIHQHLG